MLRPFPTRRPTRRAQAPQRAKPASKGVTGDPGDTTITTVHGLSYEGTLVLLDGEVILADN